MTKKLNSRPTRTTLATVSYKLWLMNNLSSNISVIENISNERFFLTVCEIISAKDICVESMNIGESPLIYSDARHCYGDID